MCDPTRHLTQSPQPLLLHDRILCLAQIVVRLLEHAIKLGLVRRQGDMFTELPEKLTIGTLESARCSAAGDQDAEHVAFHQQRRKDQRSNPAGGEPPSEWQGTVAGVGFIHQVTGDRAPETVPVNR
jgi:hypothetical protein